MKHDSFERKKKILDLLLSKDRLEFLFSESTKKKNKNDLFQFPAVGIAALSRFLAKPDGTE